MILRRTSSGYRLPARMPLHDAFLPPPKVIYRALYPAVLDEGVSARLPSP
jgi:hypothetical protein